MAKTILLADDSQDDCESVQQVLKAAGVRNRVVAVGDGADVIAYLEGTGIFADREQFPLPDVLLLDLVMPKVDGFAVLEWIRMKATHKFLIVVLSGHRGLNQVNSAYLLGAHSFLFKPCPLPELTNLINAFPEYWSSVTALSNPQANPELPHQTT